jgi:hypothetical protein
MAGDILKNPAAAKLLRDKGVEFGLDYVSVLRMPGTRPTKRSRRRQRSKMKGRNCVMLYRKTFLIACGFLVLSFGAVCFQTGSQGTASAELSATSVPTTRSSGLIVEVTNLVAEIDAIHKQQAAWAQQEDWHDWAPQTSWKGSVRTTGSYQKRAHSIEVEIFIYPQVSPLLLNQQTQGATLTIDIPNGVTAVVGGIKGGKQACERVGDVVFREPPDSPGGFGGVLDLLETSEPRQFKLVVSETRITIPTNGGVHPNTYFMPLTPEPFLLGNVMQRRDGIKDDSCIEVHAHFRIE